MPQLNLAIETQRTVVGGRTRTDAPFGAPSGRRKDLPPPHRVNSAGEKYVIGPKGAPLMLADLPPPNTRRWVAHRKAEVVAAVRGGLISLEDACARYSLSAQEFLGWLESMDRHGLAGLRATYVTQRRV